MGGHVVVVVGSDPSVRESNLPHRPQLDQWWGRLIRRGGNSRQGQVTAEAVVTVVIVIGQYSPVFCTTWRGRDLTINMWRKLYCIAS
jgi:hypothetical protein